jgi:hypothetical protein
MIPAIQPVPDSLVEPRRDLERALLAYRYCEAHGLPTEGAKQLIAIFHRRLVLAVAALQQQGGR